MTCAHCHNTFVNKWSRPQKYCSRSCKDNSQRGFEPKWLADNRGIKPRTYHLRHRDKHGNAQDREWRTMVFARDNYTCRDCKQKGGRLQAHHVKPYKAFPELRYVISNGRTLCIPCHKKTDTYGWANYWKSQIAANRLRQSVLNFEGVA